MCSQSLATLSHAVFASCCFSSEPTKLDQDVLLAVRSAALEVGNHQLVQEWRDRVLSCPEDQRQRSDQQ